MDTVSRTVGADVYRRMKGDIIFGRLEPGRKLKLEALKGRYEASLSTLRETLNRLASEGFVVAEQQRGFFVTPTSADDLTEIAELRILLECSALRASIERGDADWEGALVAAFHKLGLEERHMLDGDDSRRESWKRRDWEFHLALIRACGSANLLSLHAILYDKYLRYQLLVLGHRGAEAVAEHRTIFDAALARRADDAVRMLEVHVRRGLEHALASL